MQPGLARLTEEVATDARPALSDDLWRLAYLRGRTDVDRARPYIDRAHAGILVYRAPVREDRTLVVVDTGERLVGALDRFPAARVGSAVRLTPASFGDPVTWKLLVDEPFPLDLVVRFDRPAPPRGEPPWIGRFRDALAAIREAEEVRRDAIAAERRALPPFLASPGLETLVRERLDAIRREAERETAYSAEERAELESPRTSRARVQTLGRARQERFDARVRERVAALRETVAELQAKRAAIFARNEAIHAALRRLEDADMESRARSGDAATAERHLERLAGAPIAVEGAEDAAVGVDDPDRARDVLRAIALLARARPRVVNVRIAV